VKKIRAANTALSGVIDSMKNILIIRLTAMGDVVLTLPAVNILRENFPAAKISFLTTCENAALLQGFRSVDETLALDRAAFRGGNPWRMGGELFRLLRRLRVGKFELAVDLHGIGESAWLTRFSGAPQRWRLAYRAGRGWAYTRQVKSGPPLHPAESHLHLLEQCGLKIGAIRNEFALPKTALDDARDWFASNRLDAAKSTLYVQPFTSAAHKNWPLENYLTVARRWRDAGVQIILGGGSGDRAALEPARREGFAVSAGVSLLVTGGLMQLSTLILGGDTGALHLAVAQGKRVLMLMHQTAPGSPTPFQHPDWTLTAPDKLPIMELPVATVLARCEAMLG
jgi:ADP-heptose:LPS heptosyltransferase